MISKQIYFYGIAPCTGGLAFGYDTGSMSGILAMPQFLEYFDHPSNFRQGGITASILAGAFAGSLVTGAFIADTFGRKKTILFGSALFTVGCAVAAAANGLAALVAGRLINGMGNGCLAMMVPLYQSEITPKEIRGRIISVQQCFINFGILIAFWIQYGTSFIDGSAAWRLPMALQMIATIALHLTMYFLPESPRWLVSKDRHEEALTVLARLHANGNENDSYVLAELSEIRAKLAQEKLYPAPSYFKLLFGEERRRMWIGIGVQFWQSMTGINVIMYYAVFLFQQAGISGTAASLLANGLQGLVLNISTLPNMYWMDKWGRRIPMIIGGVGMGIAMMLIGVLMKTKGDPVYNELTKKTDFTFSSKAASNATIAFVYIYVMVFGLTWACVAWVYPPEIFSMNMRGRATSMTTATNWFVNFWFALYIPTAMNKISWKLYMVFMALCYLMAIVVYLYYPESAGKTLEEMDYLFMKGRSPWVMFDKEATKIGSIFERDMASGEALTAFEGKLTDIKHVETAVAEDDKHASEV
ncbi:general substrate transporter [Xylogone sp. PMI_703]|nr:general substrate transporter [Xylogone sp. PMI_703]